MAQSNVKLTVDATGAVTALKRVQGQTNKLQSSFGKLQRALAVGGLGLLAKNSVQAATNFQALQVRLQLLTSEYGEFAQAQEVVARAQKTFNLSITEATAGIADIFARLRPLGTSLEDIENTFVGFNSIAKLSGVTGQQASAAFTQLAQALGSGRLQGDEFRSIAEQVPGLLVAISKETGIATGALKKFASEGALESDIVLRALSKSAKEGAAKISVLMAKSPTEKIKALQNSLEQLNIEIGKKFIPAVSNAALNLAKFTNSLIDFINSDAGQATAIIAGFVLGVKALSVALPLLAANLGLLIARLKMTALSAALGSSGLKGLAAANFLATASVGKLTIALTAFKFALAQTGIGLAVIAIGAFVTAITKAINKQKEFNNLLTDGGIADVEEALQNATDKVAKLETKLKDLSSGGRAKLNLVKQLERAKLEVAELVPRLEKLKRIEFWKNFDTSAKSLRDQNETLKDNIERSKLLTDEAKNKFDLDKKIKELNDQYGEGVAAVLIDQLKENEILEQSLDLIKKKQEAADKLKEKMTAVGEEIASGIKDNLREAITGAQSFGEAISNVLNNMRDRIIDAQLDKLFSGFATSFGEKGGGLGGVIGSIFGGLFANGGRPPVGKASVVGERGPELFVPKVAGTIVPNDKLSGGGEVNVVVNVDASGSSVEGDEQGAKQFGMALSAAIQQELINQRRPGGLLNA